MMLGKEAEIMGLLKGNVAPAELVRRGYARGTVYKVKKRLEEGGTPLPVRKDGGDVIGSVLDQDVEADEEIMELRKAIRKAQLEMQLAETGGPLLVDERVKTLEEKVVEMEAMLEEAADAYRRLAKAIGRA
jgi:hypothetical protein